MSTIPQNEGADWLTSSKFAVSSLVSRVFSFHGQAVYRGLEAGIAKKSFRNRLVFKSVSMFGRSRLGNMALLALFIIWGRNFEEPAEGQVVFQYGPTRNNQEAFRRFNESLDEDIRALMGRAGRKAPVRRRLFVAIGIRSLWSASCALWRQRHSGALPQLQALHATAAYLFYAFYPFPSSVRLLSVASDHSPVVMAMLAMAKRTGLPTCYVQHAPVTEYFPPLDFDLSVLYDQASVEAYELAAQKQNRKIGGDIVILPPFASDYMRPRMSRNRTLNVGMCLSSIPQTERLIAFSRKIVDHPNVSTLYWRCHPRFQLEAPDVHGTERILVQERGGSLEAFLEKVDIVLVPNSGVGVESLHNGKPTFYVDGMDDIPRDYYKFVESGILPEFEWGVLDNASGIDEHFDASWEEQFSRYDATVKVSTTSAGKGVSDAVRRLL